jgi:hypothetical protein
VSIVFDERERVARETLARLERAQWERTCKSDVTAWAREALRIHEQVPAKHHRLILKHLQMVREGRIKRLMICCPPGSAKSTYGSMLFPPWVLQRPRFDIISAAHGSELAEDFSRSAQDYIKQNPFLGYGLRTENVKRWRTTNGGFYRAAGVGGSITGRRADGALIDDPVKGAADAESLTMRDSTWNWYQAELYTRLKPDAWIIVIMTRWHEDDLGGRLLQAAASGGDQWTVLKLPAICDSADDPMGRPIGAALWPQWQDEIALQGGMRPERLQLAEYDFAGNMLRPEILLPEHYEAGVRANVGEHVWGALYQQDPKPRGSAFFDLDKMLVDGTNEIGGAIKVPVPMPERCDVVFCLVDTAIKAGTQHNATAATFFSYDSLLTKQPVNILDWDLVQIEGADQLDWVDQIEARGEELARQCGARSGYGGTLVEDKATGTVIIQQMSRKGRRVFPINSKLTAMGKEERAIAAGPYVNAEDVKIAEFAFNKTKVHKGRSANHLISQVTSFRIGSKETDGLDLLDTFCYGVLVSRGTPDDIQKPAA